jgi:hypothetical protein
MRLHQRPSQQQGHWNWQVNLNGKCRQTHWRNWKQTRQTSPTSWGRVSGRDRHKRRPGREREKGGVDIQELKTPYIILLQGRRQIPTTTPVDKQPVTAGRDGIGRRRRREPVKPTNKIFYHLYIIYMFIMFYNILFIVIIFDISSWVQYVCKQPRRSI